MGLRRTSTQALLLTLILAASPVFSQTGPAAGVTPNGSGAALTAQEQNALRADELFTQARDLTRKRDFPGATQKLRALVALSLPDDAAARDLMAGAHVALAEVLLIQKQYQDADQIAKRGLGFTGSDAQPTRLRCDFYHLLSEVAAARGDEKNSSSYRERADACAKAGGR